MTNILIRQILPCFCSGTWCYANGTVNLLFSCPGVIIFVKTCYQKQNRSPIIEALYEFLILSDEDIGSVEPILKIVSEGNQINYLRSEQMDAAEFLTTLLDCLENGIQDTEKELFTKLFETHLYKERICNLSYINGCNTVKDTDKCQILALPIENSTSLKQSMSMFNGKSETVEVNCENACQSTNAKEITKLKQIAGALIIQLKRTYMDRNTNIKKNGAPIKIPLRFQPVNSGKWYMLTGILQQKGEEATSGHYVTYTRYISDKNVNFIYSNDDAPLVTKTYQEVIHDINCSYIFMYTPEKCVQEGQNMLQGITIDHQTSPLTKMNKQDKYLENLIKEYEFIQQEKERIQNITTNKRTNEEKQIFRALTDKLSKIEKKITNKYPQHKEKISFMLNKKKKLQKK